MQYVVGVVNSLVFEFTKFIHSFDAVMYICILVSSLFQENIVKQW